MSRILPLIHTDRDVMERVNYLLNKVDNGSFISVKDYGAAGDGVTDDTAAIQATFNEAPNNATVIFPYGHYKHSGNITVTNKSLTIIAYGATVECTQNAKAFIFQGTFGTIQSASISGSTVTVNSTADMAVGDSVKIVSDDKLPGTRVPSGIYDTRLGEFVKVDSIISSTQFSVGQYISTPFLTNVRCAKMNYATLTVMGGNWKFEEGHRSTWHERIFRVIAYQDVLFKDVLISYGYSTAIRLAGCVNSTVSNCRINNLSDLGVPGHASNAFGYAVEDVSSVGTVVSNCHFSNLRHGFTTNPFVIEAGSVELYYFGPSRYWTVSNCTAFKTTSAAFDSHHGGENGEFLNCVSYDCQLGLQLRGRHLRAVSCKIYNCYYGIQAYSEAVNPTDLSFDLEFIDCEIRDSQGTYSRPIRLSNAQDVRFKRCRIIDNYAYQTLYETTTPTVIFDDCYFYIRGSKDTGRAIDFTSATNVLFKNCEYDLSSTGSGKHFCRYPIDGGTIKFDGGYVASDASYTHFIYENTLNINAWAVNLETLSNTLDVIYAPFGNCRQSYRRSDGDSYSGNIYISINTDNQEITLNDSYDDQVFCRLLPDASRVLGTLPIGKKIGQELFLYVSGAGAFTITLKQGSTYRTWLTNKKDLVLRDGDGVNLIWQGASWIMGSTIKQEVYGATSTSLNAIANAVNTQDKFAGKMIFNTTLSKPVFATGSTAGSTWVDGAGTLTNTPV